MSRFSCKVSVARYIYMSSLCFETSPPTFGELNSLVNKKDSKVWRQQEVRSDNWPLISAAPMINMLILSLTAASVCCLVTGVLGFHLSNGAVLSSRPAIVTSSSLSLSLTASAGLASQSTVLSRLALAPVNARAHVPYITPRPHIISLSSSSSSLWAKAPTQSPSSPTQQKQQQQSAVLAPAVGKLGVLFLNLGGPERLEVLHVLTP